MAYVHNWRNGHGVRLMHHPQKEIMRSHVGTDETYVQRLHPRTGTDNTYVQWKQPVPCGTRLSIIDVEKV
jgi:hypothetical protein